MSCKPKDARKGSPPKRPKCANGHGRGAAAFSRLNTCPLVVSDAEFGFWFHPGVERSFVPVTTLSLFWSFFMM
jgi:hypothetical protein